MPRIAHVALWVESLEPLCRFYAEHFDAAVGELYENPSKGFTSRFVTFESGARLELMTTTRALTTPPTEPCVIGLAHFALSLGSKEQVDAKTRRLKEAGFRVVDGPRTTGDGYYESVVLDPEGNRLELTI
jgi:lactoylglutathione lyase